MAGDAINLSEPMDQLTAEEWEAVGFSRTQFEDRLGDRLARDKLSPAVGSRAPDFQLEVLSSDGKRTGTLLRLSSLFGKPIGLVFGSYT